MPDRSGPRHHTNQTSIIYMRDISCLILTLIVLISGTKLSAQVAPENTYLTGSSYGRGWECNHGFQRIGDICEEIAIPENAFLASTGDRWTCNRLFRRIGEECEEVIAPENGFVDTRFGVQEIHCNWGFRKEGRNCVAIEVPLNGRLTEKNSVDGWVCLRGFIASESGCEPVAIPDHAYLTSDTYAGWKCERGFRTIKGKCMAIIVPSNAHINRRGDSWECNQPFNRQNDKCVEKLSRH